MGIVADGEYRPHEDFLARAVSVLTTIWGVPILLVVTWSTVLVCNRVMTPRHSAMAYGTATILTLIATLVFAAQCVYLSVAGLRQRVIIGLVNGRPWKHRVILSVGTALAACGLPFLPFGLDQRTELWVFFPCGLLLSMVWSATTALAIAQYGKRALWLLAGFPPALYWPFWIVALFWACSSGRGCV
jgi:hypothetical protein